MHAHHEATVDNAYLLKLALAFNGMHVRASEALNASNLGRVRPEFRVLPPDQFNAGSALTGPDYKPGTWTNIKHARDTFDPSLRGCEGFDAWVLNALTINPNEAYKTHNSVLKVSRLASNARCSPHAELRRSGRNSLIHLSLNMYVLIIIIIHFMLTLSKGMMVCVPLMGEYIREFIRSSLEDGISYIELRIGFPERSVIFSEL